MNCVACGPYCAFCGCGPYGPDVFEFDSYFGFSFRLDDSLNPTAVSLTVVDFGAFCKGGKEFLVVEGCGFGENSDCVYCGMVPFFVN